MPTRPAAARRPREVKSTRDVILDAAERRFAERGFSGVSVREIAADAGLKNQASLYHHFKNKKALYEAVLQRGVEPLMELLASIETPGLSEDVLTRTVDYLAARPPPAAPHPARRPRRQQAAARHRHAPARPALLERPARARRHRRRLGAVGDSPPRRRPLPSDLRLLRQRGAARSGAARRSAQSRRRGAPGAVPQDRRSAIDGHAGASAHAQASALDGHRTGRSRCARCSLNGCVTAPRLAP